MTTLLWLVGLWSSDPMVAVGWISGPGRPCDYVQLRSGRFVPWVPSPCGAVQLRYLKRTTRNVIYDEQGQAIGNRTGGQGYQP